MNMGRMGAKMQQVDRKDQQPSSFHAGRIGDQDDDVEDIDPMEEDEEP